LTIRDSCVLLNSNEFLFYNDLINYHMYQRGTTYVFFSQFFIKFYTGNKE